MSSLALGSNVTSSIVLFCSFSEQVRYFRISSFFCFAFDSSCLFSEHLADSAAFNAASSATKMLLNHNFGLFLFSAMLWILSASSSFVHVDCTTFFAGSGIVFCVLYEHFLELPSLRTLVRDFVWWQTNSLFRFSSALKVLGDLLWVI